MLSLIRKALMESRLLLVCSLVIMFVFTWIHVLVVAGLETGSLEALLDQFEWFEKFMPVSFSELVTHSGRVAVAFDHPIVLICMLGFAISRSSDCVSGEIGRGTMEMLLAQPVSRLQVIGANIIVTTIGVALLAATAWLGTTCGIKNTMISVPVKPQGIRIPIVNYELRNPFAKPRSVRVSLSEKVNPRTIVPACINLFALGFCFSGLALLMSSWDRYRWRTIGLVIGIFVIQVLIKLSAMALKSSWVMAGTLLAGYEPQRFVKLASDGDTWIWGHVQRDGVWVLGGLGGNLLLLSLGLLAYVAATVIFVRRDIPAPL